MSDPLAEHIYQAAFDRHVLIDHTDCAALAATARAFIGDEIAKEQKRVLGLATEHDDYVAADAMEDAEQIARGSTK